MTTTKQNTPSPETVREMTDYDVRNYGLDRADFEPGTKLFLAIWPDRSAWYEQQVAGDFTTVCFNESESFKTADEAHAWLWSRVEVTGAVVADAPKTLYLTFTTKGGRKLLGRNLDSVRANGNPATMERYYDEAGTAEIVCSTEEREECEAAGPHTEDSDTLNAQDFAALATWLMSNAGLKVEVITTK